MSLGRSGPPSSSAAAARERRTNTLDLDVDPRAQDLVPPVHVPDQPARAIEGARAAERVREGGVGCEIALDGGTLCRGRSLRQEVDDVGDFGDWWRRLVGVRDMDAGLEGWTWVFHGESSGVVDEVGESMLRALRVFN